MRSSELAKIEESRPKLRAEPRRKKRRNLSAEVCREFREFRALVVVNPRPTGAGRRYGAA